MLLVCGCLKAFHRQNLETGCELLWAKLLARGSSALFGVIYRPPKSPVYYLEELSSSMLCAVNCSVQVIVCGGFNLPNIDWVTASPFFVTLYLIVFLHNWLLLPSVKITF